MRPVLSLVAFVGLLGLAGTFVGCTPEGDCIGNGEHKTLRALLGFGPNDRLDEASVRAALEAKFPVGTPYATVLAALPPSEPRPNALTSWDSWAVHAEPGSISIWSGGPPCSIQSFDCGFGAGFEFSNDKLGSIILTEGCISL